MNVPWELDAARLLRAAEALFRLPSDAWFDETLSAIQRLDPSAAWENLLRQAAGGGSDRDADPESAPEPHRGPIPRPGSGLRGEILPKAPRIEPLKPRDARSAGSPGDDHEVPGEGSSPPSHRSMSGSNLDLGARTPPSSGVSAPSKPGPEPVALPNSVERSEPAATRHPPSEIPTPSNPGAPPDHRPGAAPPSTRLITRPSDLRNFFGAVVAHSQSEAGPPEGPSAQDAEPTIAPFAHRRLPAPVSPPGPPLGDAGSTDPRGASDRGQDPTAQRAGRSGAGDEMHRPIPTPTHLPASAERRPTHESARSDERPKPIGQGTERDVAWPAAILDPAAEEALFDRFLDRWEERLREETLRHLGFTGGRI